MCFVFDWCDQCLVISKSSSTFPDAEAYSGFAIANNNMVIDFW